MESGNWEHQPLTAFDGGHNRPSRSVFRKSFTNLITKYLLNRKIWTFIFYFIIFYLPTWLQTYLFINLLIILDLMQYDRSAYYNLCAHNTSFSQTWSQSNSLPVKIHYGTLPTYDRLLSILSVSHTEFVFEMFYVRGFQRIQPSKNGLSRFEFVNLTIIYGTIFLPFLSPIDIRYYRLKLSIAVGQKRH